MVRRRPRRLLAGALVALLVATTAVTCGQSAPRQQSQTRVRVGVIQASDQLAVYVMQRQGMAADHGLRLDLRTVQSGGEMIGLMADGTLDAGAPGVVPVLNNALSGVIPDQVVGVAGGPFADRRHPHTAVLVGRDVRDWSDLSGALIAVNDVGTVTEASVRLRLALEGVADYELVPIDYPNLGLAVRGGDVAAAGTAEPFLTQSVERGDGRVLDWVIGGKPFTDFQIVMFAVRTPLLERRPGVVRDLVAAYVDAYRWINDHPAEARAILVQELGVTSAVGETMGLPRFPVEPTNDLDLLQDIQDQLLSLQPGTDPVDVSDLYDEQLLAEVLGD